MEKYQVLSVKADAEFEKKPVVLKATEDTCVVDGDEENGANSLKDSNFCTSEILPFKGNSHSGMMHRRVLLKFDISSLANNTPLKTSLLLSYG